MLCPRKPRAAGLALLAIGIAFIGASQAPGMAPFLGVGMALLGLGAARVAVPCRQ